MLVSSTVGVKAWSHILSTEPPPRAGLLVESGPSSFALSSLVLLDVQLFRCVQKTGPSEVLLRARSWHVPSTEHRCLEPTGGSLPLRIPSRRRLQPSRSPVAQDVASVAGDGAGATAALPAEAGQKVGCQLADLLDDQSQHACVDIVHAAKHGILLDVARHEVVLQQCEIVEESFELHGATYSIVTSSVYVREQDDLGRLCFTFDAPGFRYELTCAALKVIPLLVDKQCRPPWTADLLHRHLVRVRKGPPVHNHRVLANALKHALRIALKAWPDFA
mmetsp:Transcript_165038/g.524296  ORF Transcript_165038/g.524296 Transcript_165038/m.524296 type:complete len:276 (-) Transcript_165038:928-1755(-)